MTSGFILPFAIGVCCSIQGADAVLRDAFGVVALVAMTPLITIQILGLVTVIKQRKRSVDEFVLAGLDDAIIEL